MQPRILVFGLCLAGCAPAASPAGPAADGPQSVVIARSVSDLVIGDKVQLAAIVLGSTNDTVANATIAWSSDRPDIATISTSGLLRAVATGTAVISARSALDSSRRTFNILAALPAAIVIEQFTAMMTVGQNVRLDAAVTASDNRPLPNASVAWSSDKNAVATVEQDGSMHAVSPGEAYITATSGGARDTRFVIVVPAGPAQMIATGRPWYRRSISR
jgi:uncharacterized protein YjdB